jgi:hypothetical protein
MSQHVNDLKSKLKSSLPAIGSQLIEAHVDMSHPANQSFAAHPNDPSEHAPAWHQFGIVEHSIKFQESMEGSVLDYVRAWGLIDSVKEALSKEIDGVSKQELLSITALLHDIGKFTGRKVEDKSDGSTSASFEDHEAESGRLVRQEPMYSYLETHGLTVNQIEYIAHAAELHFELGKLRRVAKTTEVGYTIKFVDTPECQEAIKQIIEEHPDFALEIGLQFIADAMSKSEEFSSATDDEGIEAERIILVEKLATKGLNKKLVAQALQVPVNLRIAEKYLRTWSQLK